MQTAPVIEKSIYRDGIYYVTINGKTEEFSDFSLAKYRIDNLIDRAKNDTYQTTAVN